MTRFAFVLIASLLCSGGARAEPGASDIGLWEKVEKAMTSIQAMRYTLVKQERMFPDKEMQPAETYQVKFRKPYDIFMDVTGGPNTGRKYLWRQGWPHMKVHVFGALLQWMVPKIPPVSRLALEHDHHDIGDAAYASTCGLVREALEKNVRTREKDPTHPMIQVDPVKEVSDEGVTSYYYRSVNPDVFQNYTVVEGDRTTYDIAKKVGVQPYLLVYYNADKVRRFDDVKAGQVLRYPMYYGRITEFWIDKATLLLRRIRITDFNGKVYEEYRYRDIQTDGAAALTDADFDPANAAYGF